MLTFITAVIVFSILVIIHEFGHFIMAKISDIKVEEFAVGMGPKLLSKQKGETLFSIRAFPLGGFCKMLGEDESNSDPRAFNNKPILNRISVILFGPIMNLLLAIVLLSFVMVQIPIVNDVIADKPAATAGFEIGDKIVEIDGNEVTQLEQVNQFITERKQSEVSILVDRNGTEKLLKVAPIIDEETSRTIIGITMSSKINVVGYSIIEGIKNSVEITGQIFSFLGGLFGGSSSFKDVGGPVTIIYYMNIAAKLGLIYVLQLTALLSINLFIFNLLPIPALDGSKLVFLAIEGIRRKPVDPDKEGLVHFIGFVLLMALTVVILFKDLFNLNIL